MEGVRDMSKYRLTEEDRKLVDKFLPILENQLRYKYEDMSIETVDYEELGEFDCSVGRPIESDISVYVYCEDGELPSMRFKIDDIKERVKKNG